MSKAVDMYWEVFFRMSAGRKSVLFFVIGSARVFLGKGASSKDAGLFGGLCYFLIGTGLF